MRATLVDGIAHWPRSVPSITEIAKPLDLCNRLERIVQAYIKSILILFHLGLAAAVERREIGRHGRCKNFLGSTSAQSYDDWFVPGDCHQPLCRWRRGDLAVALPGLAVRISRRLELIEEGMVQIDGH